MINDDRMAILEEEIFILRDSGELPEIAFYSTLYYLTEEDEGPEMCLTAEERELLEDAALFHCREIILRDLDPANRDLRIYRGIRRTIYNWQRMFDFCTRIDRDASFFKETVGRALVDFLEQELIDVRSGNRISSVNCSLGRLLNFATLLNIPVDSLPAGWQELCRRE